MKKLFSKRAISILLSVLMAVSGIVPAMSAFAADGVEGYYDLQIFYKDSDTIVPEFDDDEKTVEHIEYMQEGDELPLKYVLIDSEWPDNGYVRWSSNSPVVCDVTNDGVVKAFDSSKGAVVRAWLDNEVKTIPLVGNLIAQGIEKVLFNDKVNLDSMDTEAIVDLVTAAFGSDSILGKYVDGYQGQLIDSLRRYLDNVNVDITCELCDKNGKVIATDVIKVDVIKNEEWYTAFLPNGTHFTNKRDIKTTQAKGNSVQLYAVTTPQRLGYGVVYSVKASSIFSTGKVVATVTDGGLVSFKNVGKATIMCSPDSEDVINGILEMVNYFYKLENTGTLNTDKIADVLIKYMGIDINRAVLAGLLDAAFAIYKVAGDSADPVQLTATAVEIIANIILQMKYNDSIEFTVVQSQPITNFEIDNSKLESVKEGTQLQYNIINIEPDVGDKSDIVWTSSDPNVAMVDPKTGVITALDAGGSLGALSTKKVDITATSTSNNVSKTVTLTVTGKTGKYISYAEIEGDELVEIYKDADYSYKIYPSRVATSDNLYITWGLQTDTDEQGNPVYSWADAENPVTDGFATMTAGGHFTSVNGGTSTVAMKAVTGYYLSSGDFFEISSYMATKEVTTGIPVSNIKLDCTGATGGGEKIQTRNTVNVNGTNYEYITVKASGAYNNAGASFTATVSPANATNPNVKWVCDNKALEVKTDSNNPNKVTVSIKAAQEHSDTFNLYAMSADGKIKSNVITVCISKNAVTSNSIDKSHSYFNGPANVVEMTNGKQELIYHNLTFSGSSDSSYYDCYKANWYSSDESIIQVKSNANDSGDGLVTAVDVGKATLYCVSADGGFIDQVDVVVFPDKEYLGNIIDLCESSTVIQTTENRALYKQFMKKLDLAYSVYYDQDMASQTTCDTYAQELLSVFYQLGGFVAISETNVLGTNKVQLASDYVTVKVGSTKDYRNYSYDFDYAIKPSTAMYNRVEWTSSNSKIRVDKNGVCKPTVNDPCSAVITCTVVDYMGNKASSSKTVAFVRTPATGVTLNATNLKDQKVNETYTLKATVQPSGLGGASCKDVTWSSSDESIATVDNNGVVTFVYGGDCVITCTTADGGYEAICYVNVITNYDDLKLLVNQLDDLKLNEINYYPETWERYINAKTEASNMINRGGYSQKEVDAAYAKLDDAYNRLEKYNYIQRVELYQDGEPTSDFYQYDLSVLKEGFNINVGIGAFDKYGYKNAKLDLNVRLYPNNASYLSTTWESSTSDITVTSEGVASPSSSKACYGMITCTVEDHFGHKFSDNVWVSFSYNPVTAVVLSDSNINGKVGDTYQMAVTIEPIGSPLLGIASADIKDYYWESDDTNVATVDETGLVTFVGAGSTIVRAVSYDGGVKGECVVSTEGDRAALKQALEDYKQLHDTDYTQYDYEYAKKFLKAYDDAEKALTNLSLTQAEIDDATNALVKAANDLLSHKNINIEYPEIKYTTAKRGTLSSTYNYVTDGKVGDRDALSIDLSKTYANNNNYNRVVLDALPYPNNANYKSFTWTLVKSQKMTVNLDNNGKTAVCDPTDKDAGGYAVIKAKFVDFYDREIERTIFVVMSDKIATGFEITEYNDENELVDTLEMKANDGEYRLSYLVKGGSEFNDVIWTSSNEDVATVSDTGAVTPKEKGETIIRGKSVDGGFTDTIKIIVATNFQPLAEKVNEYTKVINEVTDGRVYTEESLSALQEAVNQGKEMIRRGDATQAEVNEMVNTLLNAFNSLIKYEAVNGMHIEYENSSTISTPNKGYIRYTAITLNTAKIQLNAKLSPNDYAVYKSKVWTSSNANVTVDDFGLVTNQTATAKYAIITCTVTDEDDNVYTDSVVVSFVRNGAKYVQFNTDMIYGHVDETKPLEPNLGQESIISTVTDCKYESSDPAIASVNEEGVVTFHSQGTAIITVTAYDGGYVGTIKAYTTWDTTALQQIIGVCEDIVYTDYAYAQGMAFKSAFEAAQEVYANPYASQQEIDNAVYNLQTAYSNLENNEFVDATVETTINNEEAVSGSSYEVDANKQVTVVAKVNADAMIKSATWEVDLAEGADYQINGNTIVFTKNQEEVNAIMHYTVVDDYGRETVYNYNVNFIDEIIVADSFNFTIDGVETTLSEYKETGFASRYTDFDGIQLGYKLSPDNATKPESVEWSSNAERRLAVDANGKVTIGASGAIISSNTADITCKITLKGGKVLTKTIRITVAR